jgi:hypothetical protein
MTILMVLAVVTFGCGTGGMTLQHPSNSLAFAPIASISSGGTKPGSVVLADFNGDGKLDIAVSNFTSNTISVFLNKGDGTFQNPIVSPVQITAIGLGPIAVGDFNQDGKPDLVVGTIAGSQADIVLLGNGDGTFRQLPPIPNSFGFIHARVVDLNGDGHQDLVTGDNGNISVFLGNGDGTFSAPKSFSASFPGAYLGIVVGDFNGDNKLDIVACDTFSSPAGTLVFYAGKGDGTFQSPTSVPLISSFPSSLASGDFNGDGKMDLLIGFPGEAVIALGNGDGTFQLGLSSLIPVAFSPFNPSQNNALIVLAADLNQDGKLDALVADYGGGKLTLVLNDALGKPSSAAGTYQFMLKPGLNDIAAGDLNGDGLPDMVVSNGLTNEISIALSQKP